MDGYQEVATEPASGEAHWCTSVAVGGELLPPEVSLSDMIDGGVAAVPDSWSREDDDIKIGEDTVLMQSFASDISKEKTVVLFEGGVFVILHDSDPAMPEAFAAQINGDLVHYETPIHRLPDRNDAVAAFLQTAAWWKHHVKTTYSLDDQTIILKALYKMSSFGYLSAGYSGAYTSTNATFQSKTDDKSFVAIVSAPVTYTHIGALVMAKASDDGGWHGLPRESIFAKIGLDDMRYCKMQPRVVSIHRPV